MERETFLGRVAAARIAAQLPTASPPGDRPHLPDLPDADLATRFVERLVAIDAEVHRVPSGDAASTIDDILGRYDAVEYLAWDEEAIGLPGLFDQLVTSGRRRVSGSVPEQAAGRLAHQTGYQQLRAGITGADAALAESGSVVLVSGPGRPRMASLVPLAHIAVLRTSQIVRTLPHLIAARPALTAAGSNLVVVTGPSRTADIEMTLTLGVHGPRHLHVVLIDD